MARRPSLPDPVAVVAGKARASIEQLFALIAEVNPTDRGLPSRQQAERYALKAKLQGLLIRQHPEMIEVVAESAAGVVSLRHRIAGRDACHAMIASLDDSARRWVETELALEKPAAPAPAPARSSEARPVPAAPTDPLGRGLKALEEYDFDAARELLTMAFRASQGGAPAARALLDLLVHQLADDVAALALESGLSTAAAADPEVRGAFALAAAREGDVPGATRWLRGLEGATVAETLVVLADRAAREGNAEGARQQLVALRTADPAHPALVRLGAEVDRLRRDARAPMEQTLAAAVSAEAWAEVESQATLLLARWPESEAARSALRRVQSVRRRERAAGIAQRARAAWEASDFSMVLRLVREARALVAGDEELNGWLDKAESAANESLQLADLAASRSRFAAGDIEGGLRAFLKLDSPGRAQILANVDRVELRWLLQLPVPAGGVEAVLAMATAEAALAAGDVDAAIAALQDHLRTVRTCPDGRALASLAEELKREQVQAAEQVELRSAADALASGDLDSAELRLRRLPYGAAANELRGRVAAERVRRSVSAELARSQAVGDFAECEGLAARLGPGAVRALVSTVSREFRPRRFDDVDGTLRAFIVDNTSPVARTWLARDGRTVVLVRAFGRHLAAWVCDAATLVARCAWTWRLPVPIRVSAWTVEGDVLSVVAAEVALFRASLSDGTVLRWRRPPVDEARIEVPTPAPGGRHIWAVVHDDQKHIHTRVYDVDRWPSWQKVTPGGIPQPLWGATEPLVALGGIDKGASLHHPSGRRVQAAKMWLPDHRASRFAANVEGRPLVALVDLSEKAGEVRAKQEAEHQAFISSSPLGVLYASGGQTDGGIAIYPTSNTTLPHAAAVALLEERTYVLLSGGNQCGVMWFDGQPRTDGGYEAGTRYFPLNAVLVQDVDGQRVRVLVYTPEGLRISAVEEGDPDAKNVVWQEHYAAVLSMDGMDFDLGCASNAQSTEDGVALLQALRAMAPADRETWIAGFRVKQAADVNGQFQLAKAIGELGDVARALALINELVELHPDHPQSRFSQAWGESEEGNWAEVWTLLNGVDTAGMPADEAQHAAHLLGIAGLRTGHWNEGCHILRQATHLPGGSCNLNAVAAVLDTVRGDEVPEAMTDSRSYLMLRTGKLVRSILAADAHLAAGEPAVAVVDLDHATVWRGQDVQSAARLAEANLASGAPGFAGWLGVAGVLSARHALRKRQGHDVPLGERAWSEERLADVEARAAAWLDAGWEEA